MADIWTRKSTADLLQEALQAEGDAEIHHFRRSLSALNLVALGIGGIIGAGIFVLTGHAAAANAGPAVTLSFVLSAIACAFAGLCYAEMSSTVPICGSAYTYAYATLGELVAWIIGWDLILEYAVGAITVAVGWSGYFVSFGRDFGLNLPSKLVSAPLSYDANTGAWSSTGAIFNIPAMIIVVLVTSLLVVGIRESARFNNFMVAVKLTVIFLFIASAASSVTTANWVTSANPEGAFIPPNAGVGTYGWSGVIRGAAVVFFAYIGFDAISTAAQETKTPERDMPIGILGSLVICATLYVAVGFVLTGIVPFDKLNVPDPIAVGVDAAGVGWLAPIIKLGILVRIDLGHSRHVAGATADLSGHGARRIAAAVCRENSSALPHALCLDDRLGHRRRLSRRLVADRAGGRTRQHRNALRVRRRFDRHAGAARHRSAIATPVPRPRDLAGWAGGGCDVDLPDVRSAGRHLD